MRDRNDCARVDWRVKGLQGRHKVCRSSLIRGSSSRHWSKENQCLCRASMGGVSLNPLAFDPISFSMRTWSGS